VYASTVRQMRELDRRAVEEYGIPDDLLMENAGQAVYYVMLRQTRVREGRFLVVSGPGNNGGDSFVVARKLHSAGARVRVAAMASPAVYTDPSARNLARLEKSGVGLLDRPRPEQLAGNLAWADVVVDGLLGTGLTRDLEGPLAQVVQLINDTSKPVFSIDIPSGVDGDNGRIRGAAIEADTTVTFGLPKLGNVLGPGASLGGRLFVSPISFPPALIENAGFRVAFNEPAPIPRHLNISISWVRSRARRGGKGDASETRPSSLIIQAVDLPRSTGRTQAQVDADPISPVQELASERGTTIVVQGRRALIGVPDGRVFINPTGGSLRAVVAGRDEIVRQAVRGLRVLGLSPEDALLTGVFVEGMAADLAAHASATRTPTARDIAGYLAHAMRTLGESDARETPDGIPELI